MDSEEEDAVGSVASSDSLTPSICSLPASKNDPTLSLSVQNGDDPRRIVSEAGEFERNKKSFQKRFNGNGGNGNKHSSQKNLENHSVGFRVGVFAKVESEPD